MIPKKIHYCWFGGKPLPKSAIKCINSWKKYFPTYEIIEWNESNYDVEKIPYIEQAYRAKKYAFVSDYARFDILYHEGGVYFDTDVEVIKPFDDIILNGPFMGCEIDGQELGETKRTILVAPGLGLASNPQNALYYEILEYYGNQKFLLDDGSINTETVGRKITKLLFEHGLENIKGIQVLEDVTIYPKEYFNPINNNTWKKEITNNTRSIHWYAQSWVPHHLVLRSRITRPIHRVFGEDCFRFLKRIIER